LQEEVRSQQPHLNALHRQFEQVKQHATPEGIRDLKDRQDSVKAKWDKVTADTTERQNMLNGALRHRQNFFSKLGEFEKWTKKTQRKLDTGSEIYSDEVGETMQKLKALKREYDENEPEFNALREEFKELIANCNDDEAAILRDRFDRVSSGYFKIEDLLKNREELCEKWDEYQASHKDTQSKLKTLQNKLASPNIKEEEVAKINAEVKALRDDMGQWMDEADALDELMATSQLTIKDRATQRTLHFGSELQALDSMCDSVLFNSKQKQEHLGELAQLWAEFESKQAELVDKLGDVGERIGTAAVNQSSLQGVKDLVREIEVSVSTVITFSLS
jgi:chromosome segregation ATPase